MEGILLCVVAERPAHLASCPRRTGCGASRLRNQVCSLVLALSRLTVRSGIPFTDDPEHSFHRKATDWCGLVASNHYCVPLLDETLRTGHQPVEKESMWFALVQEYKANAKELLAKKRQNHRESTGAVAAEAEAQLKDPEICELEAELARLEAEEQRLFAAGAIPTATPDDRTT